MSDVIPANLADELIGLDDIDEASLGVARLKINNKLKAFTEEQSGTQVEEFDGVILGMIRQRVMWDPDIDNDVKKPLCRSRDGKVGLPNPEEFPLEASGLDLLLEEGVTASCADCKLKEWGTNPKDGKTPWCSEQYVMPVLADLDGTGEAVPVILTAQRASMKTTRNYLGGFKRSRKPSFSNVTNFSLEHFKRGSVEYSTPVYKRGQPTDEVNHQGFIETFLSIRDYLQTIRSEDVGGEELEDDLD